MGRASKPYFADGSWRFSFGGKKYRRATQAAAYALLSELLGTSEPSTKAPGSLGGLIDRWSARQTSAHAVEMIEEFRSWGEGTPIDRLHRDVLQDYLAYLRKRGDRRLKAPDARGRRRPIGRPLGNETLRKKVLHAAAVLKWGYARGWLKAPPDVPRIPKPPPRPKALSGPELADFLTALSESKKLAPVYDLVRFILETGCRPGEARELRWADVDIDRAAVTTAEHKTAHHGGGPRVIHLSPTAVEILRGCRGRSRTYVFPSHLGRPYTQDGLGAILKRLGVGQYRLRHTWAQHASDAGVAEEIICAQLGHSSSSMVRMYRRIADERVASAVVQLDGLSQVGPRSRSPEAKPGKPGRPRRGTSPRPRAKSDKSVSTRRAASAGA